MRPIATLIPILVFLCAPLMSQSSPFEPFAVPRPSQWDKAIENETRTDKGRPGPKMWVNSAVYDIEARLDVATARLEGRAKLTYKNQSPKALDRLRLHLRQNLHREGVRRTRRVEVTGGMKVDRVRVMVDGEWKATRPNRDWRVRGTLLNLRLKNKVESKGEVQIEIDWSFTVPRAGHAPRNGHEEHRVYYLGYWYPQFAVYDDVEGWVSDTYYGNGEFYMERSDYRVRFTAPVGWIVRATGELQNPEEVLSERTQKRLAKADEGREIISIVGTDEVEKDGITADSESGFLTWNFHANDVRDVAISCSDRYLWDATTAEINDGEKKVKTCRIEAVYEANAKNWERAAEYGRHAIESMSRRVAPYPWPHMTVCEGIIGGGMEFPMMTIIGTTSRPKSVQSVIAHELIHMWFPMMVGQNEKRWAWMDEGTTSFYTALLDSEFWKTKNAARRQVRSYARFSGRSSERASMRHGDSFLGEGNFGAVSYTKPSAVLFQLRGLLGEEVFDHAMRRYVRDWDGLHPWPHDLFNTFEDVSGRELDWYFRTWHFETWSLDHSVALQATDEGTRITVQSLGSAVMPTTVELTLKDKTTERIVIPVDFWLSGLKTWTALDSRQIKKARLNPDGLVIDRNTKNDRASLK